MKNRFHPTGKAVHVILTVAIVLWTLGWLAEPAQSVKALSTSFVVNTIVDARDESWGDGNCSIPVTHDCSLRAAIKEASYSVSPVIITFSPSLLGSILVLDNSLGMILWTGDNITVDGQSNHITIDGGLLATTPIAQGIIQISGSSNTLENLSLKNSRWDGVQVGDFAGTGAGNNNLLANLNIYGSVASGVYVHGSVSSGGQNNQINNNVIGAPSISIGVCTLATRNNYDGIYIDGGASGTIINNDQIVCNGNNGIYLNGATIAGGTVANTTIAYANIGTDGQNAMGNGLAGIYAVSTANTQVVGLVSGNGGPGVWFSNSSNSSLANSLIGTNLAGTAALGNGGDGVLISDGSTNISIGNTLNSNLISGNIGNGVRITGVGTSGNSIQRATIGMNNLGTSGIPNQLNGILIDNGASHTLVGSDASANSRNYIGGNFECGVRLDHTGVTNQVEGNFIGLNQAGTGVIPNGTAGICLWTANYVTIGSSATINQYISGNWREGIYIDSSHDVFIGIANFIGVRPGSLPAGNGLEGVRIVNSSYTFVFSTNISYNGLAGIALEGSSSDHDILQPHIVGYNGGLPIDLGNDGPSRNGTHAGGPNTGMDYPVITSMTGTSISGTTCSSCSVVLYAAIGKPDQNGGGGISWGPYPADASGAWTITLPPGLYPFNVTLVSGGIPADHKSSEMSPLFGAGIYLPILKK